MESISDTIWDVVICGTGLQQSLLALALSRSDKKILHIDLNGYYGGAEACLTLDEADAWAAAHPGAVTSHVSPSSPPPPPSSGLDDHRATGAARPALGHSRQYTLALAPQVLHARSTLVHQLVTSQAYRHLEFLAVSAFFVLEAAVPLSMSISGPAKLVRIPATREDVFADTTMTTRSKRQLMKVLKFVLAYDGDAGGDDSSSASSASSAVSWREHADEPLGLFLQTAFGLDDALCDRVLALTLSLDGAAVTVATGLARLHRHMLSMGAFGPGFAAVYPKWGGCSEVAQVACRASAVGGAVYMLGTGIRTVRSLETAAETKTAVTRKAEDAKASPTALAAKTPLVEVELTTGARVKAKLLVTLGEDDAAGTGGAGAAVSVTPASATTGQRLSRLVAVVGAALPFLFAPTVEGAPVAGGAVLAIPAGRPVLANGTAAEHPVFIFAHSSDTGECPPGQCVLYFTTLHTPDAAAVLDRALVSTLAALARKMKVNSSDLTTDLPCLYRLYYEQSRGGGSSSGDNFTSGDNFSSNDSEHAQRDATSFEFPPLEVDLVVPDSPLEGVRNAWRRVLGDAVDKTAYMAFADREGAMDKDEDEDEYEYA